MALLLPTLYFKSSYLDSLAEEGVLAAVTTGGLISTLARYLELFAADSFEVLILVVLLYVLGHRLLRIDLDWLAASSVFAGMLISAGNWLSFQIVGTLLNTDNLAIALSWIRLHPETVTADHGGRLLLLSSGGLVILALTWATACFLLLRGLVTERRAPAVARATIGFAAALQAVAAVSFVVSSMRPHFTSGTSRGYWSATAAALRGAEHWAPLDLALPDVKAIESSYRAIAYGGSEPATSEPDDRVVASAPTRARTARHIVIISLETAARKYYPLLDDSTMPAFARMASRGISSEHHLSTNPATTWAIYSMLTGTYPRRGRSLLDYGDFSSDGLAEVLGKNGYETTYLDSYRINWQSGFHRDHDSRMVKDLGFMQMEDATSQGGSPNDGDAFHRAVERERRSLARALGRIDDARAHRRHAFVFVATILGHYPWLSPTDSRSPTGAGKLALVRLTLDRLVGELLDGIDRRGLSDSVIVVVTGDHGLRAKGEFASLNEAMRFGSISFNVPFLLYAPGLFDRGIRLSSVTSHVDIAPTLLGLVGIPTTPLLLHGEDMMDPLLRHRRTFMFNNSLRPVDGYYKDGFIYVYNAFTGEARVERADELSTDRSSDRTVVPKSTAPRAADVASILDRAAGIFDTTSAYFLQRGVARASAIRPPAPTSH